MSKFIEGQAVGGDGMPEKLEVRMFGAPDNELSLTDPDARSMHSLGGLQRTERGG